MRYRSRRPLQEALRGRLRQLAATYVRYGYRRLTVLLRREGWAVNAKRIYRLYDEEQLKVRSVERKKIGRRQRVAPAAATAPNQGWAADFVSDKLTDGRGYRILTVIDQFTRECIALVAERSMSGPQVVTAFNQAIAERGAAPHSITLDNGSEFAGRVVEAWAIHNGVQLCFIRPGRPVENGFIESFNGRLRDESVAESSQFDSLPGQEICEPSTLFCRNAQPRARRQVDPRRQTRVAPPTREFLKGLC